MLLSDDTLRKLDAFALAMREHARGGTGGLRRSRALGSSVEFSDFRSYAPGDDLRRVDWNAYARFDKLFLKLFLDEQETTLRVLLDASASMNHGEPGKWMLSLSMAAALAYLALSRYDRAMVVVLKDGQARASRAFSGRAAFAEVEAFLKNIVPEGKAGLDEAMIRVPVTAGRGVCVLISDLLGDDWTKGAASLLYRRQEVSVVHVLSPQELSPELTGAVQLIDSEGGPPCDVHVSADALRRYHEVLDAFLLSQRQFCHQRALAYALIRSDMALEAEILRQLMLGGILAAR